MIKGMHITLFTPDAEEMRAFIRDKLGIPFTDVGHGWLIFGLPEGDIGVHPTDKEDHQPQDGPPGEVSHDLSFYCDDVHATVSQLKDRGVEFTSDISDAGYGLITHFRMPGGMEVQLYQPRYVKNPIS